MVLHCTQNSRLETLLAKKIQVRLLLCLLAFTERKLQDVLTMPWLLLFQSITGIPRDQIKHIIPQLYEGSPLPWGTVLQEQAALVWVSHWVTSPDSKPAPVGDPLSMGPQVPAGACSSTSSPQGHRLLQASTCSGTGSSMGCRWISAPLWTSMGCRGTVCTIMAFTMGFWGISALAHGPPPPPPSSLS